MAAAPERHYLGHVDGLRAIAILAVVANHIGLPGFAGGYVGVDVFFVISGYLIIGQIVADRAVGAFRFGDFWSRRALRILPPLALVLVACFALACVIGVISDDFFIPGQEALYSSFMVVNFLLLGQQGYFDALNNAKPFLHLWSLSVEEQFYLFAPLIVAFGYPLATRWPRLAMAAILLLALASFIACVHLSDGLSGFAFYMAPTRAWEFIAGGLVASTLPWLHRLGSRQVDAVGWLGLAAIAVAVFGFSADPRYPSWMAAVPVVGTALTIAAGVASPHATSARLLGSRPMTWIGLNSYAWYLWHWPLLVLARENNFGVLTMPPSLGIAALSLLLAWATHLWIEVPIRRWRQKHGRLGWRPAAIGVGGMALLGLTTIGLADHIVDGLDPVFRPDIFGPVRSNACDLARRSVADCVATLGGRPAGLLFGDSHAANAYPVLSAAAAANGTVLATAIESACLGLLGVDTPTSRDPVCDAARASAGKALQPGTLPLRYAILLSYWQLFTEAALLIDGRDHVPLGDGNGGIAADQRAAFIEAVHGTLDRLRTAGIGRVLIVAPTPAYPYFAAGCHARSLRDGLDPATQCALSRTTAEADRAPAMAWLNAAIAGRPDVRLADPFDAVCDATACHSELDGTLLYFDHDHLTPEGENRLLAQIRTDVDWVMTP